MKKILSIGNSLVDILTRLRSDSLLTDINLRKGSMELVSQESINNILNLFEIKESKRSAGGSAANTIHALGTLGIPTRFVGKVGNDEFGKFFKDDLQKLGVDTQLSTSKNDTGKCLVMISKDSERTFATYLGASIDLSADDIVADSFQDYDLLYLEGYLLINQPLVNKALQLAKEHNLKIAIDFASFNVVQDNLIYLKEILKNNNIHIIFANEDEAKSFTKLNDPNQALKEISTYCDIAIVKLGSSGSIIKSSDKIYTIDPVKAEKLDSTGAGDFYAAGYLYGLVKGWEIKKSAQFASLLAANVIEVIGAKIDQNRWETIKKSLVDF